MVSKYFPDSMKFGNMVSKATSDDEVPTPGYLQEELKRLTWEPDSCSTVEDSMLSRLEKKSCNVRLKTLRLMKVLVETGSPHFKRDLQRRTQAVRDCLHFRGDPHPTMGDLPSKLVRDTAQEVINAIFDTSNDGHRQPPAPPQPPAAPVSTSTSAPMPTSSVPSGVPASGSQPPPPEPKKYTGFGSESFGMKGNDSGHRSIDSYFSNQAAAPAQRNQADDGSVNQLMSKAGSALSAGISQLTGQKQSGMLGSSPPRHDPHHASPPTWDAPSNIPSEGMAGQGSGGLGGESGGGVGVASSGPADIVRSAAGQYEETLVQSLTAPGGVRAAPPKEELKALCSKAKALDLPLLIMLLCSKLEDDVLQSRLKTLHVLDALLKGPEESVVKEVRRLMRGRLPLVTSLTTAPHPALADLAAKVGKEVEKAEAPPPKPSLAPPAPRDDLLNLAAPSGGGGGGGGGGGAGAATGLFAGLSIAGDPTIPPAQAAPAAPTPQGLDQLFAMPAQQHQPPRQHHQQGDLLGGLGGSGGGLDLLGGLGGGGAMGGAGQGMQQHQGDLLGGMGPGPAGGGGGGGLIDLDKDFFAAAPPQSQQVSSPSAFNYIDQAPPQPTNLNAGPGLGLMGGGGGMLNPNSTRPRLGPSSQERAEEQNKFGFVEGLLKH